MDQIRRPDTKLGDQIARPETSSLEEEVGPVDAVAPGENDADLAAKLRGTPVQDLAESEITRTEDRIEAEQEAATQNFSWATAAAATAVGMGATGSATGATAIPEIDPTRLEEEYDPELMRRVTGSGDGDPDLGPLAGRDDTETGGTYQAARVPDTSGAFDSVVDTDDGEASNVGGSVVGGASGGSGLLAGFGGVDPTDDREPPAITADRSLLEDRIDPDLLGRVSGAVSGALPRLPGSGSEPTDPSTAAGSDPVFDEAEEGVAAGDEDVETAIPVVELPSAEGEAGIPAGDEDAETPFEPPPAWSDARPDDRGRQPGQGGASPGHGQGGTDTNGGLHPSDEHRQNESEAEDDLPNLLLPGEDPVGGDATDATGEHGDGHADEHARGGRASDGGAGDAESEPLDEGPSAG